jgi:hypothetical protein
MRKTLTILGVMALFLFLMTGAGATGFADWQPPWVDEVPQLEPAPWAAGQYTIYSGAIEAVDGNVSGDVRFAIIGEEEIDGENYFWFEFDVFNVGGLPDDFGAGEDFESLKVQVLMKEYDMSAVKDDPEAFMKEFFSMEFVKKVIFQLNDETPYDVDLSFLQMMGPMMEMSMDMAMEDEEMQGEITGMWEDADWGVDNETVTTPAGTFADALHVWFGMDQEDAEVRMDVYSHENVPLVMLVKMVGNVQEHQSGEVVDIDFELIEYGDDAEGWVTGEPQLFSFDMMGDMMGSM